MHSNKDKDDSFNFKRNNFATSSNSSTSTSSSIQNCRRRLQYNFEECGKEKPESSRRLDKSVLSVLSLNDTRRVLRNGAEKLSKTFNSVRTTFGTLTQKFRVSTKRRQILEEGPMTPAITPHTFSKQILGRTPTKLYSPFGIESPYQSTTCDKENVPNQVEKRIT